MKYIKSKLSHQLLSTIIIAFSIILISVGIILPNTMLPIYEKNLYNYLKQPLDFLDEDIIDNSISSEIGYIYVYNDVLSYSDNFNELVKNGKVSDFLSLIKGTYGNFYYRGQKYYYYTTEKMKGYKDGTENSRCNRTDQTFPSERRGRCRIR